MCYDVIVVGAGPAGANSRVARNALPDALFRLPHAQVEAAREARL